MLATRAVESGGLRITDAKHLEGIFRALANALAVGHIRTAPTGTLQAIPGAPAGRVRWDYHGPPIEGPVRIEIGGPHALYRFSLPNGLEAEDGRAETPMPQVVELVRFRREPRHAAPDDVWLRYVDIARGSVVQRRRVLDVSVNGVSIAIGGAGDPWRIGEIVDFVEIEWRRRLRVRAQVIVRHISERADGTLVAGCSLALESGEDLHHWELEIDGLVHPFTRRGGNWTHDLWELFQRSGYFELSNKTPLDFAPLQEAFASSSKRLGRSPDVGMQVVWPSSRGVEASASIIELNEKAAFLYHVARRHGNPPPGVSGRRILHDVYTRIIQWVQRRREIEWLVVWVQDAGRFSKQLHLDFTLRHINTTDAFAVPFRAVEFQTREEPPTPSDDLIVRDATEKELDELATRCEANFPKQFVEAHGLGHGRLAEERYESFGDASLRRGRRVLVVERGNVVERAAMIEWAEPGVHLFGLLDVARVFDMTKDPSPESNIVLLEHCAHQLELVGCRSFIYACDPMQPAKLWPVGGTDLGLTHCTMVRRTLFAPLLEHVWEITMGASG